MACRGTALLFLLYINQHKVATDRTSKGDKRHGFKNCLYATTEANKKPFSEEKINKNKKYESGSIILLVWNTRYGNERELWSRSVIVISLGSER
jgi:hypothetical protein